MNKVLIEEGNVDLIKFFKSVSEEAKIEKLGSGKPPLNQITYWWTRKPLIVGRAVVLCSTLKNIQTAYDLLGLSKKKRAYSNKPDIATYARLLDKSPSEITILDPFAGAGNLIFAAQEIGLNSTAVDLKKIFL